MFKWKPLKTVSSQRSIGRAHIPGLIKKGFSTPKALSWLASHGGSYRKTDFLSDWRQFLGIARKKDALKHVRKKYLPTSNVIVKTYDNMSARYKATYKVLGQDKLTGENKSFFISIVSDVKMKMQLWDELADVVAYNEVYAREFEIEKVSREEMLEMAEWKFE